MVSAMEASCLLTKAHRIATSGPVKLSADKIRGNFSAMAKATVAPYLAASPDRDSETNLPDDCAMLLPQILQTFLPEEQQNRLVYDAISLSSFHFVNFVNLFLNET